MHKTATKKTRRNFTTVDRESAGCQTHPLIFSIRRVGVPGTQLRGYPLHQSLQVTPIYRQALLQLQPLLQAVQSSRIAKPPLATWIGRSVRDGRCLTGQDSEIALACCCVPGIVPWGEARKTSAPLELEGDFSGRLREAWCASREVRQGGGVNLRHIHGKNMERRALTYKECSIV